MEQQLHKFGGRALANAEGIKRVSHLIEQYSQPEDLIVVSAMGRTTDLLMSWISFSQQNPLEAHRSLQLIRHNYFAYATGLLKNPEKVTALFVEDILRLSHLLDQPLTDSIYAEVVAHGEIWAGRLLTAYLNQQGIAAKFIDARSFLVAENQILPVIASDISQQKLQPILQANKQNRLIITGYICRNQLNQTLLLGRHGSDYSATQIAALADIKQVTIWGEIEGVYSADPNMVKNATLLPLLRLDEATELARLSSPILHFNTLYPVQSKKLKLRLRSHLAPEKGYTQVEHLLASSAQGKIVTHHNQIGLIELTISPSLDIQQGYQQLQHWLTEQQLCPLATNLNAPERRIQLVYANEFIDQIFLSFKQLPLSTETMAIRYDLAMIGIIGSNVCQNSLQMMRFFQQIKNLPIELIWQSPQKISVVAILGQPVDAQLLKQVHNDLFRAHKTIGLVVLGKGEIANKWIELYQQEREKIAARSHFDFALIGLVSSQKAWLSYQGLPTIRPNQLNEQFEQQAKLLQPEQLLSWLTQHPFDELIMLDITASDFVANHYIDYAKHGFHMVSANKRAASFPLEQFKKIQASFSQAGGHWLYNATVGGGLPVNNTLSNLVESGDKILSIEGTFSNSLAWLFYQYDGRAPFSQLVEQAWLQGLMERDPREDLSGIDALRKLIICARSAGYDLDHQQIKVQSLIPKDLMTGSIHDFFEKLPCIDQEIAQHWQQAQEDKLVLRYVARFHAPDKASIQLEYVAPHEKIAQIEPGENIFMIKSHWYRDNPLIIHGPSLGKLMSAGAILSDLNHLVRLL